MNLPEEVETQSNKPAQLYSRFNGDGKVMGKWHREPEGGASGL